MTFRTKLLVVSSITLAGAVALTTGAVSILTRRAFDRINEQRRTALVAQLQKQLEVQSRDVEGKAQRASANEGVFRLAVEASRAAPDLSAHYDDARPLAEGQSADFLDLLQPDGTIISSAHWPARFAYKNDWQIAPEDFASPTAFLTRVPVPEGKAAVAMVAVRPVAVGEKKIFVAVGKKLDATFLASMGSVPGTRTLLWLSPQEVLDANGPVASPDKLGSLATQAMQSGRRDAATIQWSADRYDSETVFPIPLTKRGTALGVLLVATSLAEQLRLERSIVWTGVLVGGAGILLGILIGWWATERITRPIASLSEGVRAVASGDWSARVPVSSADEIGELASSFNRMTEQLVEQRDRTVQAERVAAWRELARRLAHELKNPLFPLQITVENMKQARDRHPEQFDEVFRESTSTLLAEIGNLKTIIGRFSDFSKIPTPEFESVDVSALARDTAKLFGPQLTAEGRVPIELKLDLASEGTTVPADPEQLGRAMRNLILNAMDAMPGGGTLTIRTTAQQDGVRIEVSDTGAGLTEEECARLFTPYYTTKSHGTGLGLAIVQSVVSDHHGRISVHSAPNQGARFEIDLPARRAS